MLACGSPWLFAAYRVLRRQSVPWHPPCALVRLICLRFAALLRPLRQQNGSSSECLLRSLSLCSFQGAGAFSPLQDKRLEALPLSGKPSKRYSEGILQERLTRRWHLFLRLFASPVCLPAFSSYELPLISTSGLAQASQPSLLSLERR